MAVEIPVYVDIQGAFDRAVREIPKEMPKLEKVISNYALNLKIDYGGGGFKTVRNLLTDTTMDAGELEFALKRVRKAFDDAVAKGASKKNTSATVNNLAKAYGLLEQRAKGFYDSNAVAAMRLEDTIAKITYKITELKAKMASLAPGSDLFNKYNYELKIQQQRLVEVTRQQTLYKAEVDASNSSLSKQSGIVKQLTGYFGGLYAAHTVLRFVKQVRDVTGELEYQRVALGHLLQDEEYGNELFGRIIEAAKESPFRIKDLVTYTKQLAAYRIEEENLYDTTMRLADISAGLGVDMNRLILAFGQVRAASVLRGQELRQFTEAGIPLVELLADKFSDLKGEMVSTADVFKLISERAVPFEYIKEIFEDLTNAGGMFYKMQEEQAKTLQGRWEKLKDAYDQALMSLGSNDTFQSWNDLVLKVLNGIAKNLSGIVRVLNAASVGWLVYKVAVSDAAKSTIALSAANIKATRQMVKMMGVVGTLRVGLVALRNAWRRFTIALSSNWVGLALSAIATLITYFSTFRSKTKNAAEDLSEMQKAIDAMKTANEKLAFEKGLISNYESLASVTERTAVQSRQLSSAVSELRKAYPELSDKIGNTNVPLEEQIQLLGNAAEEAHKLAVEEAKSRLITQQGIISRYEDELNAAKQEKEIAQERQRIERYIAEHPVVGGGSEEQLKKRVQDAAAVAKQAEDAYDAVAEKLAKAKKEAKELEDVIDPRKKTQDMQAWAMEILELQKSMLKAGDTKLVFTEEDLRGFDSVYDMSRKLKKRIDDLTTSLSGMQTMYEKMSTGKQLSKAGRDLKNSIDDTEKLKDMAIAIRDALGLVFGTGTSAYAQDPFIKQMQDRMKFMKDFKSGYDKLLKYMSSSDALEKESDIMLTRGLSMGIGVSEQQRAAKNLSQWYEDMYNAAFDYLKNNKGVTGTMQEFLSRQITGNTNRDKMLKDFQSLIQSLFDAKTDFDTAQIEENIEKSLKRLSDEIKRSETARNFYKNILDMTGDEELAANMTVSVYGDVGKEFKDRMQQQLDAAFQSLDWSELPDDVFGQLAVAVSNQDFNAILDKLELFPEEWQKVLKQMASDNEKYNADYLSNLYKTYQKAKTFDQRRQDIRNREAQKRAEIEANTSLTDEQKAEFTAASRTKEAKDLAKINVEELKNTYEWTKAFEDLDRVGSVTLVNLREKIEAIIEAQKDILTPEDLKALTEALTKIRDTQTQRDPITAFASSGRKAALLAPVVFSKQGSKAYDKAIEKIKKFNEQAKETDKIDLDHLQDAFTASVDDIEKGAEAVANYASQWKGVIDTISDVFELDEIPILGETIDGVSSALGVVAAIIPVITVETTALSAAANSIPFVAILTAIVATLGAIIGMIKGIINAKVERLNQKIETQKEYVNDLERAYDRLGKAIEKSFGTDYIENYRKSLENLAAQQAAYQEQARLEREKGKKSDEKKAREYEEAAVDVTEKIEDAQGQIAEFFAGTDLTSAAKDFASAWLDAYREFGSITTAMKEKFQDMLGEMVENAMFAQLAQTILRPFYDEINRRADDGQLSAKDVADIASMVPDYIESLNGAFTVAANQLQAYGYNLRETAGTMTGISRSVAGASEESINGLAAGINTQNFYMQHIDANVALILSSLTGGATTAGASVTGEVVDPYKDVVLKNVAFIPTIDRNLAELLAEVRKVIKPRDAARSSSHVLVTNL